MDDNAKLEVRRVTFKGRELDVREDGEIWACKWKSLKERNYKRKKVSFYVKEGGYLKCRLSVNGKSMLQSMHEIVAHAFIGARPNGLSLDHIDGNPSNNHHSNLRYVTQRENTRAYNRPTVGATSKYRGVSWDQPRGKWKASITVGDKVTYIGRFNDEQDAARAFDEFAAKNGYDEQALNRTHHPELKTLTTAPTA